MQSDLWRLGKILAPIASTCAFCLLYFLLGVFNKRLKLTSIVLTQGLCMLQFSLHAFAYGFPMLWNFGVNFIGFTFFYIGIKMRVIGLTGGIATGKSSVSAILKAEGFTIIDCDEISREMRKSDKSYQKQLIKAFGPQIWDA